MLRLLKEFVRYLKTEKKWWLIPLLILLLAVCALLLFGSGSGIGWSMYPFV